MKTKTERWKCWGTGWRASRFGILRSRFRPAGIEQLSTGQLHWIVRITPPKRKKQKQWILFLLFWSECRDSLPFRFAESKELLPSSRQQAICHWHIAFDCSNHDPQTEETGNYVSSFPFLGPSVEIRTRGLLNPIQARYQTSPHPDASVDCQAILAQRATKSKYFFDIFKKRYSNNKQVCHGIVSFPLFQYVSSRARRW